MNNTISIFTPTYNRKELLANVYKSLLEQTDKNFIWLIIDDGSTDGTKKIVKKWIADKKINIEYYYKRNGGKHTAYNLMLDVVKTDYIFIALDSDDTMPKEAVIIIKTMLNTNEGCWGIVGQAVCTNGKTDSNIEKYNGLSLATVANMGKMGMETSIIIKTSYAKKFKYPEIEGESFMTEAYTYIQMKAPFIWTNKAFRKSSYRNDGLSRNICKLYLNNPKSWLAYQSLRYKQANSNIVKTKSRVAVEAFSIILRMPRKAGLTSMLFRLLGYMYLAKIKNKEKRALRLEQKMQNGTKTAMIATLYGEKNYGNKLQNYAVYKLLEKRGIDAISIKNNKYLNYDSSIIVAIIRFTASSLKQYIRDVKEYGYKNLKRRKTNFRQFSKNIPYTKSYYNHLKKKTIEKADYLIVGSDQVWNPNMSMDDLMLFNGFNNCNKIAISASIALPCISDKTGKRFKKCLESFKAISLREENGKRIIEECTGRNDIERLIDPTMMLNKEEWAKLITKPAFGNIRPKRYILLYFLGGMTKQFKKQVEDFAKEQELEIIDIYNKKCPWIICGPSEFLYLEKNAALICTDSYHSTVFGFIFNTPIVVTGRNGTKDNMNSRIDTLLKIFKLQRCKYDGNIKSSNLIVSYKEANLILKNEKKKAESFLDSALRGSTL